MAVAKKTKKNGPRKASPAQEPNRLETFSVETSHLGQRVTVNLASEITVLVGHNGAGKSLLMEALSDSTSLALDPRAIPTLTIDNRHFDCALATPKDKLTFSFDRYRVRGVDNWSERCESDSLGILWEVKDGRAEADEGRNAAILPAGMSLLSVYARLVEPTENVLRTFFGGIRHVAAGVPRQATRRSEVYLKREDVRRRSNKLGQQGLPFTAEWEARDADEPRLRVLARTLLGWSAEFAERFSELNAIGERTHLWKALKAPISPFGGRDDLDWREVGSVELDGVNIGVLSDGTLRMLEILVHLVDPEVTVLLIEEPETSIHPGLLMRLMNEFEAYSHDKQIVLSTHASSVVSRVKPEALRLVRRHHDKTTVTSLGKRDLKALHGFLEDEGTLGDYVFGGGVDE